MERADRRRKVTKDGLKMEKKSTLLVRISRKSSEPFGGAAISACLEPRQYIWIDNPS